MVLPLTALIENACNAARFEPDQKLNVEICHQINSKGGNAPHVAAMTLARYVNSRSINQALLALTLLDCCVKQCGYPFHLQIATKEFLNTIVRKFPGRPPTRHLPNSYLASPENQWNQFNLLASGPFSTLVIDRILFIIKQWKLSLVDHGHYQNDLVHIRDMYRLLKFKGYIFPEVPSSSIEALVPDENKTVEQAEEDERAMQSAKLQELIRRATPQDLVEANRLIKKMVGYDKRSGERGSKSFSDELHRIRIHSERLFAKLEDLKQDEAFGDDGLKELNLVCANARAKMQHLATARDDREKMDALEAVDSLINEAYDKFDKIQASHSKHQDFSHNQAIRLIDLDDDENPSKVAGSGSTSASGSVIDLFDERLGAVGTDFPSRTVNNLADSFGSLAMADTTPANGTQIPSNTKAISFVKENGLEITLRVTQRLPAFQGTLCFSNQTSADMENMAVRLAAPKSVTLRMDPISHSTIPASSNDQVSQTIYLNNPGDPIRLRYIITYNQFGVTMEQTGTFSE